MEDIHNENVFTNRSGKTELDVLLTNRCNLRCKHCLYTGGEPNQDLDSEHIVGLLNQLAGTSVDVHFLGGEPLCRSNIVNLVQEVTSRGLRCQLLTNGYALSEALMAQLHRAGLGAVGFSVDGPASVHNANRGRRDAFQRVVGGIRLAQMYGYEVKVSTAVHSETCGTILDLVREIDQLGVKRILIEYVLPIGRGQQLTGGNLPPAEWNAIISSLREAKESRQVSLNIAVQSVFRSSAEVNEGDNVICGICRGGHYPVVDAWANYYPCILYYAARWPSGNLLVSSWRELSNPSKIESFTEACARQYPSTFGPLVVECPPVARLLSESRISLNNLATSGTVMGCFHRVTVL